MLLNFFLFLLISDNKKKNNNNSMRYKIQQTEIFQVYFLCVTELANPFKKCVFFIIITILYNLSKNDMDNSSI